MNFIETVKGALPDYAKDTRLNLDAVLLRSTLDADVAIGCAVASLAATGNGSRAVIAPLRLCIESFRGKPSTPDATDQVTAS